MMSTNKNDQIYKIQYSLLFDNCKYSPVDQSFWSKVDSDTALLPSWFNW